MNHVRVPGSRPPAPAPAGRSNLPFLQKSLPHCTRHRQRQTPMPMPAAPTARFGWSRLASPHLILTSPHLTCSRSPSPTGSDRRTYFLASPTTLPYRCCLTSSIPPHSSIDTDTDSHRQDIPLAHFPNCRNLIHCIYSLILFALKLTNLTSATRRIPLATTARSPSASAWVTTQSSSSSLVLPPSSPRPTPSACRPRPSRPCRRPSLRRFPPFRRRPLPRLPCPSPRPTPTATSPRSSPAHITPPSHPLTHRWIPLCLRQHQALRLSRTRTISRPR